jgi:hypothetical protein
VSATSAADALAFERRALQELAGWNVGATVESTFVPMSDAALSLGLEFLRGSQVMSSRRGQIVVRDPAMKDLMQTVARVAAVPINALILGETGVGKDVVASLLHDLSPRKDRPFVVLNCASLPETLLETELFGHERGAFTGALTGKVGLLESADAERSSSTRSARWRCPFKRSSCGSSNRESSRASAASRRDGSTSASWPPPTAQLDAEVAEGAFRRDLYHRLNGVSLTVPPLRGRRAEIEPLARHFLSEACARFTSSAPTISRRPAAPPSRPMTGPATCGSCGTRLERAVLLAGVAVLEPHHLGLSVGALRAATDEPATKLTANDGDLSISRKRSPPARRTRPGPRSCCRCRAGPSCAASGGWACRGRASPWPRTAA